MIQPHSQALSADQIELLLDGLGGVEAIDVLRDGQHSKFLHSLASIIDLLPREMCTDAVSLLDIAKDRNDATCKAVLTYPHVATWGSAFLRRILGASNVDSIEDHLSYFSSVAVVAAWKSGVPDFSIRVSVRDGCVVLPSLGRAMFHQPDVNSAVIVSENGKLRIVAGEETVFVPDDPHRSSDQWENIRVIAVTKFGLTLELHIDDVDPYRATNLSYPHMVFAPRLDNVNFKLWDELISGAWGMLVEHQREHAIEISRGMKVLVPLEDDVHKTAFYRDGFGAIVSTTDSSASWIAQSMLEEFQRMKLNAFHWLATLHTSTQDDDRYFAPWSDGSLPFNGLLEGFYSTVATMEFWGSRYRHTYDSELKFEAAVAFSQRKSWEQELSHRLSDSGELTELGRRLLVKIRTCSRRLTEDISLVVSELTRNMAIDQRITWRLKNIVSDSDDIERLADAWKAGMACPVKRHPRQSLRDDGIPLMGRRLRRKLGELQLARPQQFAELLENQNYLSLVLPGATLSDAWFVADRFEEATQGYRSRILQSDDDGLEDWAGLAVVGMRMGNETASTLGRFPEIVAALYFNLRNNYGKFEDPLRLAKWLEPLLLRMDDSLCFENEYE